MPMDQSLPNDLHLNLLRVRGSRRTTVPAFIPGSTARGNVISPLQAKGRITHVALRIKSVDASTLKIEAISLGSSEFNWRDYYTQALRESINDIDETPSGEVIHDNI